MRDVQPLTPATIEAAQWWLDEVRAALPEGTPARAVEGIVMRQAERVSVTVLVTACRLAGVPADPLAGGSVPPSGRLASRLAAVEVRRLAS